MNRAMLLLTASAGLSALSALPARAQQQPAGPTPALELTVGDVGVSIGDSRRTLGLRLNFRDRRLEEAVGVNATVWYPYPESEGVVRGVALGLPVTGAERIDGLGLALLGLGADGTLRGVAAAPVGVAAGDRLSGIAVAGLGVGAGDALTGLAVGGSARGMVLGGVGAGVGDRLHGLAVGGVGVGVGENATGIVVGGVGAGVGGRMRGISAAGLGLGIGKGATGLQLAGLGIGSGGTLRGVSVAGAGIGAVRIEGLAAAAAVGARDARGVVLAPAYFSIEPEGRVRGISVSAFNHVRGTQQGLAIGLFNFARELDGVQLGLLNYAANKRSARLLPFFNYARTR